MEYKNIITIAASTVTLKKRANLLYCKHTFFSLTKFVFFKRALSKHKCHLVG